MAHFLVGPLRRTPKSCLDTCLNSLESLCAAPNGAQAYLLAYPPFRLRVRSPQGGLTCGRTSGAWFS